ncbi:hypothetical protein [Streptomyces phaeochromogenes]|uniref:hypothetical protein n=1 Tax=Streptomyces phaeochromogenes TaxID=1923 RepID=UPI0036A60657
MSTSGTASGSTPPAGGSGTTPGAAQRLMANPRFRRAAKFTLAALVTTLIATLIPLIVVWIQSMFNKSDTEPLDVTVSYGYRHNEPACGGEWLFPKRRNPPKPGNNEVISTWAHQANGIDLYETDLILNIQGSNSDAVNIQRIRVTDLKRTPLPNGVIGGTPGCGAKGDVRTFHSFLGEPLPRVLELNPKTLEYAKSDTLSYFVTSDKTEKFLIFAYMQKADFAADQVCTCVLQWKLAIDWTYHGQEGTTVVDDQGAPFQTADGTWSPQKSFLWTGQLTGWATYQEWEKEN